MKNTVKQITKYKKLMLLMLAFVFGLTSQSQLLYSQVTYNIADSKEVNMKLSGTSTLHNWNINSKDINGEAQFSIGDEGKLELKDLQTLTVAIPTSSLKSKEKAMDKNVFSALKADKFKDIVFKTVSAEIQPKQNNKYQVKTVGNLTIAGVTKQINLDVFCQVNTDGSITCNGSEKIKMTDYQIKPPTFLLGAMKTGDEVTLDFTVIFKKSNLSLINK